MHTHNHIYVRKIDGGQRDRYQLISLQVSILFILVDKGKRGHCLGEGDHVFGTHNPTLGSEHIHHHHGFQQRTYKRAIDYIGAPAQLS